MKILVSLTYRETVEPTKQQRINRRTFAIEAPSLGEAVLWGGAQADQLGLDLVGQVSARDFAAEKEEPCSSKT